MTPIVGKTYIIKTYITNQSGWDPNGRMMKYMGRLVTVTNIEDYEKGWCRIDEDGGRWSWNFMDLEPAKIDFGIEELFEI
jgi:hypothetical protein